MAVKRNTRNGAENAGEQTGSVRSLVTQNQLGKGLEGKVDKEEGKGLSENDFTDELKEELEELADGRFAEWYPDGSVTSEAQFTQTLQYSLDPEHETAEVLSFSDTGGVDNSGATGDIVVPPYIDRGSIRYKVVGIAGTNAEVSTSGASLTSIVAPTTVTKVGNHAMHLCISLTSAYLPGVDQVGSNAFAYCYALTSPVIPLLNTAGERAFAGCTSLASASFPVLTTMGQYTFDGCTSLASISIPNVTSIGAFSFRNCALTSISLPVFMTPGPNPSAFSACASLEWASLPVARTLPISMFSSCTSLKRVYAPMLSSMANAAFNGCTSLETASFSSIGTVGNGAFGRCSGLKSISIPVATSIGTSAFNDCTSLVSVDAPMATNLNSRSFEGCTSLKAISLPAAETIGGFAFYGDTSLKSVELPSVMSIEGLAFSGCAALSVVNFGNRLPSVPTLGTNAFPLQGATCTIVVPDALYDSWTSATNWSALPSLGHSFVKYSEWEAVHALEFRWKDRLDYNDRIMGHWDIYFRPRAFDMPDGGFIKSITVKSSDTVEVNETLKLKIVGGSQRDTIMAESDYVNINALDTEFTFTFSSCAELNADEEYLLGFYRTVDGVDYDQDVALRIAVVDSPDLSFYNTNWRPYMRVAWGCKRDGANAVIHVPEYTAAQALDVAKQKYTKPSAGIPESDMAVGVRQRLLNGNNAYTMLNPQGGTWTDPLSFPSHNTNNSDAICFYPRLFGMPDGAHLLSVTIKAGNYAINKNVYLRLQNSNGSVTFAESGVASMSTAGAVSRFSFSNVVNLSRNTMYRLQPIDNDTGSVCMVRYDIRDSDASPELYIYGHATWRPHMTAVWAISDMRSRIESVNASVVANTAALGMSSGIWSDSISYSDGWIGTVAVCFKTDEFGMPDRGMVSSVTITCGNATQYKDMCVKLMDGSTVLSTSDTVCVEKASTAYTFTFPSPVSLRSGTEYKFSMCDANTGAATTFKYAVNPSTSSPNLHLDVSGRDDLRPKIAVAWYASSLQAQINSMDSALSGIETALHTINYGAS